MLTADDVHALGLPPWPQHFGLEQGREYLVLAIYSFVKSVWGRGPVVQIAAPPDPLPTYAPMCLFDVTDPRTSQFWTVEAWGGALAVGPTLVLTAHFMEDLADDVPEVRNQFDELYALMLAESATS